MGIKVESIITLSLSLSLSLSHTHTHTHRAAAATARDWAIDVSILAPESIGKNLKPTFFTSFSSLLLFGLFQSHLWKANRKETGDNGTGFTTSLVYAIRQPWICICTCVHWKDFQNWIESSSLRTYHFVRLVLVDVAARHSELFFSARPISGKTRRKRNKMTKNKNPQM